MKKKSTTIYLSSLGLVNALGAKKLEVLSNLSKGYSPGMQPYQSQLMNKSHFCGVVKADLPTIPTHLSAYNCRNNQLALAAIAQIQNDINDLINRYGAERIGIVMGSSTSGIMEAEQALASKKETGKLPIDYHYKMQEVGAVAEFLGAYLEIEGPCYLISTACSSSGKIFSAAKRLLEQDHCDAVIMGGVDSLCDLTLGGFDSLEAISTEQSNPFSMNRKGINIGEAAAIFLATKESSAELLLERTERGRDILLLGVGETSDAYHMSAPEPTGRGAKSSMQAALKDASFIPDDVDYINLHGTGTRLNDCMEAQAVSDVFGSKILCSSTKPLTGHTLGAAGATETAICWLLINHSEELPLPVHKYDGQYDPDISSIHLVSQSDKSRRITSAMSNSFAFGGNNVSVIIGSYK